VAEQDDEREEEHTPQDLSAYLDAFKHFSTLSAALAVAVVVVYQERQFDPWMVTVCLVLSAISVITSAMGIYVTVLVLTRPDREVPDWTPPFLLTVLIVAMSGLGFSSAHANRRRVVLRLVPSPRTASLLQILNRDRLILAEGVRICEALPLFHRPVWRGSF
jgi:hypothetical protein